MEVESCKRKETVGNFCLSPSCTKERGQRPKSRKSSKRFFFTKVLSARFLMLVMLGEKGKWEPVEEDCETDHIFSDV